MAEESGTQLGDVAYVEVAKTTEQAAVEKWRVLGWASTVLAVLGFVASMSASLADCEVQKARVCATAGGNYVSGDCFIRPVTSTHQE